MDVTRMKHCRYKTKEQKIVEGKIEAKGEMIQKIENNINNNNKRTDNQLVYL